MSRAARPMSLFKPIFHQARPPLMISRVSTSAPPLRRTCSVPDRTAQHSPNTRDSQGPRVHRNAHHMPPRRVLSRGREYDVEAAECSDRRAFSGTVFCRVAAQPVHLRRGTERGARPRPPPARLRGPAMPPRACDAHAPPTAAQVACIARPPSGTTRCGCGRSCDRGRASCGRLIHLDISSSVT